MTAKNVVFDSGLRKGYLRHVFSGCLDPATKLSQPIIALSHFSEDLLLLNSKHAHGPYFIKTISFELGKRIGLTGADQIVGSRDFYALPNQTAGDVQSLLNRKEVERYERTIGTPPRGITHRISSTSKLAVRNLTAVAEAIEAVSAEKDRKRKLREDEDIDTKSSLSERQIKLFKRLQKENKVLVDDLRNKLAAEESKCEKLEVQLAEEKEETDYLITKHNSDINLMYSSGLQRRLILSETWHASNPSICSHLFGFHTFLEFKVYCNCLFPEMALIHGVQAADIITEWEKCCMVKLRMRRGTTLQMIGAIWSRSRHSVGVYVSEWAPRWETVGSYLSELDLTQEYLDAERPQIFADADQNKVSVLVDGKDFMLDDPKKNSAMKKAVWSDKVQHAAGRIITWSTPSGLTVEHTPMYMARATESAIVALWGSYHGIVPLGKVPLDKPPLLKKVKAENYEEKCPVLAKIIKEGRRENNDAERNDDDSELLAVNDEHEEAQADGKNNVLSIDLTERGQQFLRRMREREAQTKTGKKYSMDAVVKFNSVLLRKGPNESCVTKLDQLQIHESLHLAYKNGSIKKCQFSYYLKEMEPLRAQMLRHLRGEAGDSVAPVLNTRLEKLPIGTTVLADRGFYFDAPSYPNVDAQVTPHFLTGRDQFESSEISSDLVTCKLRWSSEAVFSRVTDHNALTDVIPYSYFSIMGAMIEWSHAHANLMQPFNNPTNY